jgi:hypothetical protein
MPRLRLALLAVFAIMPPSARAIELPQEHPLWVAPVPEGAGERREAVPALLTLPPGWSVGDAAVVILARRAAADSGPARLRTALLAEGAAVLELDPRRIPASGAALAWLRGALHALRRTQGAGLLVAVGFGDAGGTALQAAREASSAAGRGTMEDSPAAGAALEGGGAGFAAGRRPMADEGWPVRAPLLCAMLAALLDAAANAEAAERDCLDALIPEERRRLAAG